MAVKKIVSLFVFVAALIAPVVTAPAVAQGFFGSNDLPQSSAELVETRTVISRDAVRPGEDFQAALEFDIADTWHINSFRPLQDYLIATELSFETHPRLILAETQYPSHKLQRFDFAGGEQLAVYEGREAIFLSLRGADGLEPGDHTLEGTLRVQACNDEICLAPSNIDIALNVTVVPADTETEAANEDLFARYEPFSGPAGGGGGDVADLFSRSWILAFGSIFLIGLALNLTPCVYPMMSVTVSLFGGQQTASFGASFVRALVYVFGIVVMYSVLGVIAALTGSLFGAWLQSPWVLGAIGVLLFLLALSMFGLYELQLPSSWMNKLGAANQVTGFAGLFLSGLVVGIFAAPCIGPPIIALLAFVGSEGNVLFGLGIFSVLAFGLGVPYLLLGTFSGLLQRMPKSGVWMVWVKKLFGVVLVGAALFYLGLAFAPQLAPYAVVIALVFGGVYLGFLERSGDRGTIFHKVKMGVGGVALVAGLVAFAALQRPGIEWEPYSPERVEQAIADGTPVMMDFYADWCVPCLELDRVTFTDRRVVEESENFVRLKVDLTQFDSEESEALRRRYEVAGVPTIVFLDPTGEEIRDIRVVGFVNANDFLGRIERVPQPSVAVPASY